MADLRSTIQAIAFSNLLIEQANILVLCVILLQPFFMLVIYLICISLAMDTRANKHNLNLIYAQYELHN